MFGIFAVSYTHLDVYKRQLWICEYDPSGPGTMDAAVVGDKAGPSAQDALDFFVARAIRGTQVEVHPVLPGLGLRDLEEQHRGPGPARQDQTLLLARQIGVVRLLDVVEQVSPPS